MNANSAPPPLDDHPHPAGVGRGEQREGRRQVGHAKAELERPQHRLAALRTGGGEDGVGDRVQHQDEPPVSTGEQRAADRAQPDQAERQLARDAPERAGVERPLPGIAVHDAAGQDGAADDHEEPQQPGRRLAAEAAGHVAGVEGRGDGPPISAVPSGSKTSRTKGREAGAVQAGGRDEDGRASQQDEDPDACQTRAQPSR